MMTPQHTRWVARLGVDRYHYLGDGCEPSLLATLLSLGASKEDQVSHTGERWKQGSPCIRSSERAEEPQVCLGRLWRLSRTSDAWAHTWRVSKSLPSQQVWRWQCMEMRQRKKRHGGTGKNSKFRELVKGQYWVRVKCYVQRKSKRAELP